MIQQRMSIRMPRNVFTIGNTFRDPKSPLSKSSTFQLLLSSNFHHFCFPGLNGDSSKLQNVQSSQTVSSFDAACQLNCGDVSSEKHCSRGTESSTTAGRPTSMQTTLSKRAIFVIFFYKCF